MGFRQYWYTLFIASPAFYQTRLPTTMDDKDDNDDDLLNSLGGNLMKDLLAGLAVDDDDNGWISLEELERELGHLEKHPLPAPMVPASAASLVVTHQTKTDRNKQEKTLMQTDARDAWSLSLEKFSAAALEEDFLQADASRKQQFKPAPPPGLHVGLAAEYNVDEKLISPPPGLQAHKPPVPIVHAPEPSKIDLDLAAAKLLQQVQGGPYSQPLSNVESWAGGQPLPNVSIPKPSTATPHNSVTISTLPGGVSPFAPTPPPSTAATPQVPRETDIPQGYQLGMLNIPTLPPSLPAPIAAIVPPVAVPVTGFMQSLGPFVLRGKVHYCNPHPQAQPIPAATLASKYMTSRDISYVVHGILRHVQAAGASTVHDYDVQYWVRRNGEGAKEGVRTGKTTAVITTEREIKAKEFATKHATLGYVTKSNVTRPRALIMQPSVESTQAETLGEQKQRAALWKSRIYVDQAYQAFLHLREFEAERPISSSTQHALMKLLKCMGLQKQNEAYSVADRDSIKLLMKLDKGKILVSRILELGVLPPNAVAVAMPVILQVVLDEPAKSMLDDHVDNRLLVVLSALMENLPQLEPQVILECVKVVVVRGKAAEQVLSSMARMQYVHSLLQRGGRAATELRDEPFAKEWETMEQAFLSILAGL